MRGLAALAVAGAVVLPPTHAAGQPSTVVIPSEPPNCGHWGDGIFWWFLSTATADSVNRCLRAGADVHARADEGQLPLLEAAAHLWKSRGRTAPCRASKW